VGPCTFRMTEFPGHACDLAREATLASVDIIVAVGGDGTLSEVSHLTVHVLPIGCRKLLEDPLEP
jgi:diacylglycerol kinase family enzyme